MKLQEEVTLLIHTFPQKGNEVASVSDYSQHFLPEREWTKMDLLRYFGVEANEDILNSGQCGCGIILIRKSNDTIRFIEKFRDVFFDHFELCDDSPLLGSYGRRIASRLYDAAKRLLMESQRLGNQS